MAKTVGEAIRAARIKLNEDEQGGRWMDRDLREWINEAQRTIARRFKWYRKTATLTAVASTQTYTLPNDCLEPTNTVSFKPTGTTINYPMEYRDQRNVRAQTYTWFETTEAVPRVWWTDGYPGTATFTLGVYPTPSQGGSLIVPYYGIPTDIDVDTTTDTTTGIAVPEGFESLVVQYVVYQAWLSDGDPRWEQEKAMFEAELEAFQAVVASYAEANGEFLDGTYPRFAEEQWV